MSPLSTSLSLSASPSSNSWKKFLLHLLRSIFHEAPSILPLKFLLCRPFLSFPLLIPEAWLSSPLHGRAASRTSWQSSRPLASVSSIYPAQPSQTPLSQAVCVLGVPQLGIPRLSKLFGIAQTAFVAPSAHNFFPEQRPC